MGHWVLSSPGGLLLAEEGRPGVGSLPPCPLIPGPCNRLSHWEGRDLSQPHPIPGSLSALWMRQLGQAGCGGDGPPLPVPLCGDTFQLIMAGIRAELRLLKDAHVVTSSDVTGPRTQDGVGDRVGAVCKAGIADTSVRTRSHRGAHGSRVGTVLLGPRSCRPRDAACSRVLPWGGRQNGGCLPGLRSRGASPRGHAAEPCRRCGGHGQGGEWPSHRW